MAESEEELKSLLMKVKEIKKHRGRKQCRDGRRGQLCCYFIFIFIFLFYATILDEVVWKGHTEKVTLSWDWKHNKRPNLWKARGTTYAKVTRQKRNDMCEDQKGHQCGLKTGSRGKIRDQDI